YWLETPSEEQEQVPGTHPLLGRRLRLAHSAEARFESRLSLRSLPFLAEHQVGGRPVLPAAAFLEIALQASRSLGRPCGLADFAIEEPLLLSDRAHWLQTIVAIESGALQVSSADGDGDAPGWARHVRAVLADAAPAAAAVPSFDESRGRCRTPRSVEDLY